MTAMQCRTYSRRGSFVFVTNTSPRSRTQRECACTWSFSAARRWQGAVSICTDGYLHSSSIRNHCLEEITSFIISLISICFSFCSQAAHVIRCTNHVILHILIGERSNWTRLVALYQFLFWQDAARSELMKKLFLRIYRCMLQMQREEIIWGCVTQGPVRRVALCLDEGRCHRSRWSSFLCTDCPPPQPKSGGISISSSRMRFRSDWRCFWRPQPDIYKSECQQALSGGATCIIIDQSSKHLNTITPDPLLYSAPCRKGLLDACKCAGINSYHHYHHLPPVNQVSQHYFHISLPRLRLESKRDPLFHCRAPHLRLQSTQKWPWDNPLKKNQ